MFPASSFEPLALSSACPKGCKASAARFTGDKAILFAPQQRGRSVGDRQTSLVARCLLSVTKRLATETKPTVNPNTPMQDYRCSFPEEGEHGGPVA